MKRRSSVIVVVLALVLGFGCFSLAAGPNILTMSCNQEFGTIDPQRGNDWTESMAMVNVYDALVFPNTAGDMEPKLATTWDATPDGLIYTFTVREGVKFHDGSEVTAEDVKFAMERALALKEGYSWLWADVVEEVTVEGNTVTFRLNKPFAPFLSTLAWLFVANKDLCLANKKPGDSPEYGDYGAEWLSVTTTEDVGSGPYTLKAWDRGREIVFARFGDYFEGWPQGDKSIDEVHVLLIRENATVRTMFKKGEMTIVEHWRTYSDYEEMDSYPNGSVISFMSPEELSFKINTKRAPTDCIHIRRMLAWAMDYDAVLNIIEPGSGKTRGPVPDVIPGHNPRVFSYYMDLDKAREEMEQSKYYPNIPPILAVAPTGLENRRKMALRLQENLATLGVTLNISMELWGRMTDLATTPETTPNIMITSVSANYPDPDTYLYCMYHSKAVGTWMSTEWLQDPLVDQLIEQERVTLDPEERAHIMNVLQHIIVERCPDVYVYVMPLRAAIQDYLKGFTPRPVMSFYYYYHDWWYEK
ncbi:ABC transporter substrate-binding protein [Candidatus Bipolaricaulota bacterium]|nr:ABC transporter substrate-binding protein [Candidatus Bipolaricaulota bacterium]